MSGCGQGDEKTFFLFIFFFTIKKENYTLEKDWSCSLDTAAEWDLQTISGQQKKDKPIFITTWW